MTFRELLNVFSTDCCVLFMVMGASEPYETAVNDAHLTYIINYQTSAEYNSADDRTLLELKEYLDRKVLSVDVGYYVGYCGKTDISVKIVIDISGVEQ